MDISPLGEIVAAVGALFVSVVSYGAMWLAQLARAKIKSEKLRGALARLTDSVGNAVNYVAQVYVDEIRKAAKDGRLTKNEARKALDIAIEAAKEFLGPRGIAEIIHVMGIGNEPTSVHTFLRGRIEAALGERKLLRRGHG